jgi:putative sigma-54 modulation protein
MSINLNLKATNFEITPAISDYVSEKIGHIEKFIHENDTTASLMVDIGKTTRHHQTGDFFKAHANLHTKNGDFVVSAEESDIYAAIDIMKDELEREITTAKDKKITRVREGGRQIKEIIRNIWPF